MSVFVTKETIDLFLFIREHQPITIDDIRAKFPDFNQAEGAKLRNNGYLQSPFRQDTNFLIHQEVYSLGSGATKALQDYENHLRNEVAQAKNLRIQKWCLGVGIATLIATILLGVR